MKKNANGGNPAKPTVEVTETLTPMQLKKIVGEINKLAKETVERGQMDIGDLVLKKVFQGSLSAAYSRDPYKNKSLRQITDEEDLMVNRRRLGEWVRAAGLRKELIAKKVDCSKLSYSHFAALLQVNDVKKCNELAAKANKENWSARMLIEKIGKKNAPKVSDGTVQKLALPSDMPVGRVLEALANPLVLMEDKEVQQILGNPHDLEKLPFDIRLQVARLADGLVNWMVSSLDLLKLAKRNIALIELGVADAVDVQADVV